MWGLSVSVCVSVWLGVCQQSAATALTRAGWINENSMLKYHLSYHIISYRFVANKTQHTYPQLNYRYRYHTTYNNKNMRIKIIKKYSKMATSQVEQENQE